MVGPNDSDETRPAPAPAHPGTAGIAALAILLLAGFPLLVILTETPVRTAPTPTPTKRGPVPRATSDYAPAPADPAFVATLQGRLRAVTLAFVQSEAYAVMDAVAATQPTRWLRGSGWFPPGFPKALPPGFLGLAPDELRAYQDHILVVWREPRQRPGVARGCYLLLQRPGAPPADVATLIAGEDLVPLPLK